MLPPAQQPRAGGVPAAPARLPGVVPTPAATVEEVLVRLDAVIADAVRARSRLAYFACLYRSVTARVLAGIHAGRFEDGPRMARLDVIFANRYLAALSAWRRGADTSRSWLVAFEAAAAPQPIVLQHLLLGMNAHINLDLGIAAAQTAPGAALPALRRDFVEITVLLGELLDDVQGRLARVSPWMGWLDTLGGRTDEELCTFGIARAREAAWHAATVLAALPPAAVPHALDEIDAATTRLARPIRSPGGRLGAALLMVRARETADVAAVVRAMS